MATARRGHNAGIFGGDQAAALLAGLWTPETLDRVVDAGIIAAVAGLLGWQGYKRPRTTGVVAAVWLLWFVCKLLEGKPAWEEFTEHASRARGTTEGTAREAAAMLAAWAVLFLPIAADAQRALAPVAWEASRGLAGLWRLLTWWQRGLLALCLLALGGTAAAASKAAAAVQRYREAVAEVFFQLSFAVCGPCLWWLTAHLPQEISSLLVGAGVSFVPVLLSVRALVQLEREREGLGSEYEPLPKTGLLGASEWSQEEPGSDDKDAACPELQRRLAAWLSYWSCWPILHVARMMRNTELVPEETKPAADGLLLALAAWAQVWQASRVAPYVYVACAGCLSRLSERVAEAASAAGSSAAGLAVRLWQAGSSAFLGEQSGRWALVAAVAAAVLVVASLVLDAMALANALLTLGILVGVAFDSARIAAGGHSEVLPSRLAFWVVSISWLWLCDLPLGVGSLLAAWTPLVLAVAAAGGELLLKAMLRLFRAAASALLARRSEGAGGDGREAASAVDASADKAEDGSEHSRGMEARRAASREDGEPG